MLSRLMKRSELQSQLSKSAGVTEAAAGALLDERARLATEELKNNGAFLLPDIGVLERRESPARIAKNPETGETIHLRPKVHLKLEIASRLRHAVTAAFPDREGTITTTLFKASRSALEALDRDGAAAKEWKTLDPKGYPLDGDFTALLDEYGDLFAYILKTEGRLDETTLSGLTVGYVTPESLETRVAELQAVSLEALEQSGLLPTDTNALFSQTLGNLKEFLAEGAAQGLGLIVVTHF